MKSLEDTYSTKALAQMCFSIIGRKTIIEMLSDPNREMNTDLEILLFEMLMEGEPDRRAGTPC